jgi:DNA replication protein DnaC
MESNPLLETYLRQLHLPGFIKHYRSLAKDAAQNNLDYSRYLLALVESEIQNREQTRIQSRVKAARFPTYKELADFDFSVLPNFNKARILDLARGEYITKHETLIFIGNPGLGKSHLTVALALTACRMGKRVRFWTAAGLVNELLLAQEEKRLNRFIAMAHKQDLIILDELGFIPFTPNGAHALFTFCSELYERTAMIITTNLQFANWIQLFGDERLTAALLDRLTHHAHIIELTGESYRFRQRMQVKDD